MDCEIEALIKFIEAREPGNELREIAKTRLSEALRIADIMVEPEPRDTKWNPIPLIHIKTGQIFRSAIDASRTLHINRNTIHRDVNLGRHKYGLFPASQYSNQKA